MTIAIVAAAAIGELITALVITAFVLVAEILEEMTVEQVAVEDLAAGGVVLVEPDGRIPVDGTVVAGSSFVDQATVTGESMPAEKTAGDRVFAGTVNLAGTLDIRVDGVGEDTTYGRIVHPSPRLRTSGRRCSGSPTSSPATSSTSPSPPPSPT